MNICTYDRYDGNQYMYPNIELFSYTLIGDDGI